MLQRYVLYKIHVEFVGKIPTLIITIFAVQFFISPKVLANPGDEVTDTQILLLDKPGTMVTWNAMANLGARLISSEDGQPVEGQDLSLYLNESTGDGDWNLTLVCVSTTGSDGIANFSFFVDLRDGMYNYTIIFAGDGCYLPASNASHFIVTGDPYALMTFNVTNLKYTVEGISFDFSASITPPAAQWIGIYYHTYYGAKINDIQVSILVWTSINSFNYPLTTTLHFPQSSDSASGSVFTNHVGIPYPYQDYTLADLKWMTTGYLRIETSVTVLASYIDTTWYWFIPVDTTVYQAHQWFDSTETIGTPNITPPQYVSYASDPSVTLQQQVPYNLYFTYMDAHGWTGNVRYKFYYPNGTESAVFEVDGANSTSLTSATQLRYGIPYATWSQYPGATINFSTQAIDNYNPPSAHQPGGYPQARLATAWTDWETAGTIFSEPGGAIHEISAWGQLGTTTWISQPVGTNFPMYIDDPNWIAVEVVNPNPVTDMIITSPFLTFSSPFGGYRSSSFDLTNDLVNAGATLTGGGELAIHPGVCSVSISKRFMITDFEGLTPAQYALLDTPREITIELSFTYSATPYQYSATRPIVRPPAPTVEFLGFTGPQESGHFILKSGTGGATVQAAFRVTNHARIPIDTTHLFSFTPGDLGKISLTTNNLQYNAIAGLASATVSYSVQFTPSFFDSEEDILGVILNLGTKLVTATVLNVFKAMQKYKIPVARIGGIINFLFATYYAISTGFSIASLKQARTYLPFNVGTMWDFIHYGNPTSTFPTAYNAVGYSELQTQTTSLYAEASGTQMAQFWWGVGLRFAAVALYGIAGVMSFTPAAAWAPVVSGIGDAMIILVNKVLWKFAKDNVLPGEDYTSVVVPEYTFVDASNVTPTTEFEVATLSLSNSTARLEGDMAAINETLARKESALADGDYQAVLLQNDALANYTQILAADYAAVQNALGVTATLLAQNSSEIASATQSLESIALGGFGQNDTALLQAAGFNQTEIAELNQTLVDLASAGIASGNITGSITGLQDAVNVSVPYVNAEIESLENASSGLAAESIEIKVSVLGENVTTASNETLTALQDLENQMLSAYDAGDWNGAIAAANQLADLARQAAMLTNNQSYLLSFGADAQNIKTQAGEYLKVALQHVPEVVLTPGEASSVTLIVRSEGAPSGDYKFEVNSTWVGLNGTSITVTQYNAAAVQLPIFAAKDPLLAPGKYPVRLRVYLPGTGTTVNSLLIVKITPFYDVQASGSPPVQAILDNETATFQVYVTNQGNVPDAYHLALLNLTNGIPALVEGDAPLANDTLASVAPGATRVLRLQIRPTSIGTSNFVIAIKSPGTSAVIPETLIVTDDDTAGPVVTIAITGYNLNATGGIDVTFVVSATDPLRGIDLNHVYISAAGQTFNTLGLHVVTVPALGNYTIAAAVSNLDNDWPGDEEWTIVGLTVSITPELITQLVVGALNELKSSVTGADMSAQRKVAMAHKIDAVIAKVIGKPRNACEEFHSSIKCRCKDLREALDKLVHDIMPKLTGEKATGEHACGKPGDHDGNHCKPWVRDVAQRAQFKQKIDAIRAGLALLLAFYCPQCSGTARGTNVGGEIRHLHLPSFNFLGKECRN